MLTEFNLISSSWRETRLPPPSVVPVPHAYRYCSEFLIHAADVEGLCQGIDQALVTKLGEWCSVGCTYAGGGKDISDLALVDTLSNGKVDLTFGSALDLFGGSGVKYADCVAWNHGAGP